MRPLFWWEKKLNPAEVSVLEARLQSALQPVTPRPQFIRELCDSLKQYPAPAVAEKPHKTRQYVLIGVASFISGTFVLILGVQVVRALVHMANRLHPKHIAPGSAI
jgi:hypothetical protein